MCDQHRRGADRQALEINQAYYGSDHPQMAHNLTTLALSALPDFFRIAPGR